ncbi:hypothetical protein JI721_08025 [Alicyclobacillus cycloheptanicus]|uniref:Uncharacterized protein n=1 Tax=Alicyclobacillus cycloheptanicus TaxID=1457 RepID=A0ABT9XL08_9BACL|nr:hypothetical protein [Alicyclobacillus cycloheptanicus]MDQ0190458.1 hypothetical protein [Alicyclobacillus cycloheptanicus]WDM02698.1 hypothetical protein JI721_08025 [Alicyclobacillus cycloheptanicus]
MGIPFVSLALISVIVAIDNALLAGMLLPQASRQHKNEIMVVVGVALAFAQIGCAMGVGRLLTNEVFRALAVVVLIWMSIRTVASVSFPGRTLTRIRVIWRVFFYTVVGNIDNMIWLGTELRGHYLWLAFFSVVTIPLFIIIAVFLSGQCEKHQWILVLGAGMMAWAAASLVLQTPGWKLQFNGVSTWVIKTAMGSFIVLMGFIIRELLIHTVAAHAAWRRMSGFLLL